MNISENRSSDQSTKWIEVQRLAKVLSSCLDAGEPVFLEEKETPIREEKGKVILVTNPGEEFLNRIDEEVENVAALIVALDIPQLATGEGKGYKEILDELKSKTEALAWSGLTFSNPTHYERHAGAFVFSKSHHEETKELLKTGVANLALHAGHLEPSERPARVCIATNEIFGPTKNGGIGTACTSLAHALAESGNEVTVLFQGDKEDLEEREVDLEEWKAHYQKSGINFVPLVPNHHSLLDWEYSNIRMAHVTYLWLEKEHKNNRFDVIHFAECNGHGYFTTLAKRLDICFEDVLVSLTTHSSTEWIFESNHVHLESYNNLSTHYMENESVKDCDLLIGPSLYLHQWMRQKDWKLPANQAQQQYVQPHGAREGLIQKAETKQIREIVFFGRLETRKGLVTFCDALELMSETKGLEDIKITFLGKEAMVEGEHALKYIKRRSTKWDREWQIIDNYQQDEAMAYLEGDGRMALMPSIVDNSPNTVMECIGLGVPFVAARTGGIPELIHPEEVATSTFYHRDVESRGESLATVLTQACLNGHRAARPAVDPSVNEPVWSRWHRQMATKNDLIRKKSEEPTKDTKVTVCLGLRESDTAEDIQKTIVSIKEQTVRPHEILASGSSALLQGIEVTHIGGNEYDTEAYLWNLGAQKASNDKVLFVSAGVVLENNAIEVLAKGINHGDFGALTSYRRAFVPPALEANHTVDLMKRERGESLLPAEEEREKHFFEAPHGTIEEGLLREYPIGGDPLSNLVKATTGQQVLMVTKKAYDEVGEFKALANKEIDLDSWLVGATVKGIDNAAVPIPLWTGDLRRKPEPDSSSGYSMSANFFTRLAPLVDPSIRHLPSYARAMADQSRIRKMVEHIKWQRSELSAHKDFIEEREEHRKTEKASLKEEIRYLKQQVKELGRQNKSQADKKKSGFFKKK